jgi:hypothetical protein
VDPVGLAMAWRLSLTANTNHKEQAFTHSAYENNKNKKNLI